MHRNLVSSQAKPVRFECDLNTINKAVYAKPDRFYTLFSALLDTSYALFFCFEQVQNNSILL